MTIRTRTASQALRLLELKLKQASREELEATAYKFLEESWLDEHGPVFIPLPVEISSVLSKEGYTYDRRRNCWVKGSVKIADEIIRFLNESTLKDLLKTYEDHRTI